MIQNFKLIKKINLTHNVFEMIFEGEKSLEIKPGQFVTFLLDKIGGRAYSILEVDGKSLKLIIKKWELDEGGRGGSKYISELKEGEILKGVGPAGHFLLQENNKNKMFIGTGTGLVPLYNQILGSINNKLDLKLKLIFGLREKRDVFYTKELEDIKRNNSNFDFEIYLSRDDVEGFNRGYVTEYLTKENISDFEEFYICGMPSMIESAIEILKSHGISEENIFFEKY